jgi:VIT1/CCC1 family predicted Fe2+/Mn2+ transporter
LSINGIALISKQHNYLAMARDVHFTRWLFRAYLVLLFVIPLPLGSNRPLFWSLMVAAVALLALVWGVGWLVGVARWPQAMRGARWVLGALGLLFANSRNPGNEIDPSKIL